MTRRSALVALAFAGAAQLSTGCQCMRPLFPRLRECLGCGSVPAATTTAAVPVGVGLAPPPAYGPVFAPPAGDIGGPGCATCESGGPSSGPIAGPVGHPVHSMPPVTGPVMLDPTAGYPVQGGPIPAGGPFPGYAAPLSGPPVFSGPPVGSGPPSTLLPPPSATPMPTK